MKYIKENWKFLVFVLVMGLIGGLSTAIYSLNEIDPKLLEEAIKQMGSKEMIVVVTTIQYMIYAGVFSALGIILSNKVKLWTKIKLEEKTIKWPMIISLVGGIALILGDILVFGHFNDIVKHSFDSKPSLSYIIASYTYGGVIEEVMLRLFFLSFIAWIIAKIIYKNKKKIPTKVFIIANIISAITFALLHLPSTIQLMGKLDAVLVIRCMIMNGGLGLAFGWLYRKYGIHYAMLAHFGCHLIANMIWILFI